MSTEFTLGQPMQLGIKGSKQCFRGRSCPLVPLRQSAKRLPIPRPPSRAAGDRVTASPNGDSFSQINRIVKPRVSRASDGRCSRFRTILVTGC
jgi:hypothetical protein